MLNEFANFIVSRERLRLAKEVGATKLTDDPILATYRFCNVNRMHDRTTIGLHELWKNWTGGHFGADPDLWFTVLVGRLFNQCHTMQEMNGVLDEDWEDSIRRAVRAVRMNGKTPFNGAYIVSTNGVKMEKVQYLIDRVLTPAWESKHLRPHPRVQTCEAWGEFLTSINGVGDFIANQVVSDLRYMTLDQHTTKDWETWVLGGPGTIRGLNRFFGKPVKGGLSQHNVQNCLRDIRSQLLRLPASHPFTQMDLYGHFHDINNLSNCFCEWDKYMRAKLGEGRPKQLYRSKA